MQIVTPVFDSWTLNLIFHYLDDMLLREVLELLHPGMIFHLIVLKIIRHPCFQYDRAIMSYALLHLTIKVISLILFIVFIIFILDRNLLIFFPRYILDFIFTFIILFFFLFNLLIFGVLRYDIFRVHFHQIFLPILVNSLLVDLILL